MLKTSIADIERELTYKATLLELQRFYNAAENYYPVKLDISLYTVAYPVLSDREVEKLLIEVERLTKAYRYLSSIEGLEAPENVFPSMLRVDTFEMPEAATESLEAAYSAPEEVDSLSIDRQRELLALITEVMNNYPQWETAREIRGHSSRLKEDFKAPEIRYVLESLATANHILKDETGEAVRYKIKDTFHTPADESL